MDRLSAQTRAGILLESLYYLDKYENERIALYKSLDTANRIKIDFDFSTNLIFISAILPIDSVDLSKPITSPERVVFPEWNGAIEVTEVVNYVLVPGFTISIDTEEITNEDGEVVGSVITIVRQLPYYEAVISEIVYSTAATIAEVDAARSQPRKNISISFDELNLKAIIEAVLPFNASLLVDGSILVVPYDD